MKGIPVMDTEPVFPGAPALTVDQYLNQREFWLDDKTWKLVPIDTMSVPRRLYAARGLARTATALISVVESQRDKNGDLIGVMSLIGKNPKEWVTDTPLYGALYRGDREPASAGVNGTAAGQ
jgi:hypothetical protein